MVGCFLTPSLEAKYTYPAALKDEIAEVVGEYLFDTKDFRTDDKEYLLRQVYEMTDRRFALAEHLLETKPWSLFAMVEMGPDRMHHGFWKYMDPEHRKHEPGNPYESAILDYHRHVDGLIGKLLEHADDDTVVFVLSDHGAKRLDGGIRINEWLRREGLLATLAEPNGVSSLRDVGVDWSRTTAWGEGGYYARVFLNVAGPRAGGDDPARGVRGRARRPRAPHRGDPGRRRATRSRPPSTSRRSSTASRRASRPTSSSSSATSSGARSGRSAATRASRRSRTTPAPTTRTTRRTGCTSSPARASSAPGGTTRTCSTSRRPCSSCSGSRSRRGCAGRSLLARSDVS